MGLELFHKYTPTSYVLGLIMKLGLQDSEIRVSSTGYQIQFHILHRDFAPPNCNCYGLSSLNCNFRIRYFQKVISLSFWYAEGFQVVGFLATKYMRNYNMRFRLEKIFNLEQGRNIKLLLSTLVPVPYLLSWFQLIRWVDKTNPAIS